MGSVVGVESWLRAIGLALAKSSRGRERHARLHILRYWFPLNGRDGRDALEAGP